MLTGVFIENVCSCPPFSRETMSRQQLRSLINRWSSPLIWSA